MEPAVGHLEHDNGMDGWWLKGQTGNALHLVLCAAGYNSWLLRAIVLHSVDRRNEFCRADCFTKRLGPLGCGTRLRSARQRAFPGVQAWFAIASDRRVLPPDIPLFKVDDAVVKADRQGFSPDHIGGVTPRE